MDTSDLVIVILAAIAGFAVSYFIGVKSSKTQIQVAETRAKEIIDDAQKESENLKREKLLEVKDEFMKKKRALEEEHSRRKGRYR